MKKTHKITFNSIKKTDEWMELATDLKFEKFKDQHPDLSEDLVYEKFVDEIVYKKFKYGEFGDFEIIVDEDFNIVGGKIL